MLVLFWIAAKKDMKRGVESVSEETTMSGGGGGGGGGGLDVE